MLDEADMGELGQLTRGAVVKLEEGGAGLSSQPLFCSLKTLKMCYCKSCPPRLDVMTLLALPTMQLCKPQTYLAFLYRRHVVCRQTKFQ